MLISGERRHAHFRAHERRHVQLTGSIWHPGGAEPVAAQILNLGLGGAGVACGTPLRVDDATMLTIESPSLLDPLVLSARVAWVQLPPRPGLVYAGLGFDVPERSSLLTLFQLLGGLTY